MRDGVGRPHWGRASGLWIFLSEREAQDKRPLDREDEGPLDREDEGPLGFFQRVEERERQGARARERERAAFRFEQGKERQG
ncbi:hypothetical protein AMTR_s00053p00097670 [Amborella trichopoda]|uniref:Uncharacterized protein n=1 Tax=Amborella trichopoda TaxID=13333 RepID=W1PBS1_AMBTC|nr:hypothetical protein AMTR_s00053p00097670 [Amborella trichopoda]